MAKVLDNGFQLREFEIQSLCYVLFQTYKIEEKYKPRYPTQL